ncbi:hypothetical protein ACOMHN_018991 [Nucella lapillus]
MEENEKWHASVTTSNQFSVLDPEQNPNPQISHPPPSSPSPFDRLMKKPVPISCDELLLGDSVLCAIGEGPSPHSASAKNLSVPGLTVSHLLKWLSSLRPFPHIRRVTLHVGINSCIQNSPADSATWQRVVRETRRVFPHAVLKASSIIPPYGRHHASRSVRDSNLSLAQVCTREGVIFIDHTSSFQTKSGAPRKSLYRTSDPFHPSPSGTAVMRNNLHRIPRPLLPTPATNNRTTAQVRAVTKPTDRDGAQSTIKGRIEAYDGRRATVYKPQLEFDQDFPKLTDTKRTPAWGMPSPARPQDTRKVLETIFTTIQQALQ